MHRFGRPHSQQEMRFPSIHKSHKKHWVPYLYKKCVTQQDDEQFAEDKKKKKKKKKKKRRRKDYWRFLIKETFSFYTLSSYRKEHLVAKLALFKTHLDSPLNAQNCSYD